MTRYDLDAHPNSALRPQVGYDLRECLTSSTEETARQRGSMTVVDYDDSVHNDRLDTLRVLVRIVESRGVGDRVGVEEDEIRGIAHGNCATVRKAKGSGHAAGHLVDSSREGDKIEIAGVMSENPGKRSIEPGVWLALPCDAVRCDAWTFRRSRLPPS